MATITKPMALDESFNTTESTSRNQADVLVGIEQAIVRGFGQVANAVSYDNTDSGLTADNVQDAIDEVDDTVDGLVDDVTEISSDIESTQTASGNPLTLTDAAPINAESLVVEFSPKQDLHGQSAPYVGGAGKNKLNYDAWKNNQITRGTAVWENYGVTLTATGNDCHTDYTSEGSKVTVTPNTTCTLSWDANNNNSGLVFIFAYNSSGTRIDLFSVNNAEAKKLTITVPANTAYITFRFGVANEGTTIAYKNIQILFSSEVTPFAPYSNICPITGYTECEVDVVGKNLFDKDAMTDNSWLDGDDGHIASSSGYYVTDYIPIYSDVPVYIPATATARRFAYDENKVAKEYLNNSGAQVYTPNFNGYLRVTASKNTVTPDNLQIEYGNQSTTYEPYHSSNASIQFGQTVYGGSVDFKTGVLTVTHKCVDMGDIVWYKQPSVGNDVAVSPSLFSEIAVYEHDDINFKCSEYTPSDLYDWHVNGNITIGNVFAPKHVNVCNSDFVNKTNEEIQTMLQGVQLWYELETPFTIQLTPDELKLLKGTNHITTNGTTINLGYQPDNVIGELKGEIEKCAVDDEFAQFTDGNDTFTDVNLTLDGYSHTVSMVGSKIEQKRFICFEVAEIRSGSVQGILASCIAFTDGAKTPSGTAFRAYIESLQMYVNFRIYGSGGSYTLAYQSETSFSASAFYVRVRMMNNL